MSNEISVRSSLKISIPDNNFQYQSTPTDFQESLSVATGPTPGVIPITITGTNVDLSKLAHPGLCFMQNLENATTYPNNFVTIGVYDGASFFPLIELPPGKGYVFRLSRFLNNEFIGTGTNADSNQLRAMANQRTCSIRVEAFEAS